MQTSATSDGKSEWDELRRIADELELQLHLGGMETRDRWRALQPRIQEVGRAIARSGERLDEVVTEKLKKLRAALRKLREEIPKRK